MKLTTIFFDLDGTLLPMDEDAFVGAYFKGLAEKLAPLGYEPQSLLKSIWTGVKAMVNNSGACTNEEMFWRAFTDIYGEKCRQDEGVFEDFYINEFQRVQHVCGFDPEAAEVITKLKHMGYRLVLATNPLFPRVATESRIRWAGLSPEDFVYISTYENSRHSKPNLDYYKEIMDKVGVLPEECLMVGNNVEEDMIAEQLGMSTFLCTKCLLNKQGKDIAGYKQGDLSELLIYVSELQ